MSGNELKSPKLFISYSWTNQGHIDWVRQLATDLRGQGIESIFDQWHLKEGQDSASFMEQMVHDEDIRKVVLVCDAKYVERANQRKGGVGAESQIITSKVYGDVQQTKFVALALAEDDTGDLLLPNFLTSRIAIDFRDQDAYAEKLEQLVRWAFDKPFLEVPPVGSPPSFLDRQSSFKPISLVGLRTTVRASDSDKAGFIDFLTELSDSHSDFTLDLRDVDNADDVVVEALGSLAPLLSQLIAKVRDRLIQAELDPIELDALLGFFERVLANYRNGTTNWAGDATKFFGSFSLVSVVALALRYRRFQTVEALLGSPALVMERDSVTAKTVSLSRLGAHLASLDYRNDRLKLNRASLTADFVKDMCAKVPIEFWEFLQADFYLFLFFDRVKPSEYGARWWPDSNLYATDRDGAFPLFAKAIQPQLRHDLLGSLALDGAEELDRLRSDLQSEPYTSMRWRSSFSRFQIWSLGNFDVLREAYE